MVIIGYGIRVDYIRIYSFPIILPPLHNWVTIVGRGKALIRNLQIKLLSNLRAFLKFFCKQFMGWCCGHIVDSADFIEFAS